MSGISRMVYKIVIAFVLVSLFLGFVTMMQSEEENMFKDTINSVMSDVPFSESTVEVICEFIKYPSGNIPIKSTRTVFEDLLRLLVMAVIQAPVIGLLTSMLLPLPKARNQILALHLKPYEDAEAYMNQPSYKLKKLLLTVLVTPILSILAAWITEVVAGWIQDNFSGLAAALMGSVSAAAIFVVSLVVLVMNSVSLKTAILWRLLVTMLGPMAKVYLIDAVCLCIYVTLITGALGWLIPELLALFLIVLIMEEGIKLMQRAVVGW